jgi:radical SAM protein
MSVGDFTQHDPVDAYMPLHFNALVVVAKLPLRAEEIRMNFDQAPMLVIWEVTQACDLACVHCRASAQSGRDPRELNTAQGFELLDQIKSFGNPLMVFTGGDPLKRPDIFDLIRHSAQAGLRTNVTPSATPLLTETAIDRFQECGVSRMAISLDGPDAKSHDDFRGVPGTFDRAMLALHHAKKIGLETQYQTTVTRRNLARLPEMAKIAEDVGAKMWSLFFLIVTGRALENDDLAAEEYERVFDFMYELSKTAPFAIKTTEAMHYRRYVAQRMKAEHRSVPDREKTGAVMWRTAGVSDGKGFVFVSHTGEIFPSGFLPITAGNVLRDSLTDVYRHSGLFRSLRDMEQREGKCGLCEYQKVCGGSRARAYALTGNYLAEDPRCTYRPHLAEVLELSAGMQRRAS